jgi:hypothetical protein
MMASFGGHVAVLTMLLAHGASVNDKSHVRVLYCPHSIIKSMIQDGRSALDMATKIEIRELLLAHMNDESYLLK